MARSASVPIANVFEIYQQHLKTHHHAVSVPFAVTYVNDIEKPFCNMYSIVITAQSTPLCKEISEIEIPVLKGDKGQETLINLRFIPLEPHPLTLYFSIKEVRYCQSAFCFDVKKDDLPSIVEERWKPFIIEKLPNTLYAIAIFLPPRNHLLMKISIVNEKPFINILVDSILILPWANVYLQEITHTTGI
ncbi:AP-5 complex subunit beta-1-like isoform X3 [Stegodyphus dumicola]|uniref:AP-5 complex subunit beta-1-like isoform X3 n=1 Tax=Stegodyphus dumicola TaxID=202533 RepID=UPI0015AE61B7|nr:AP-5 complex subunit beta-1-like isoform X3 [Stegodyphus dumicola]